MTAEEFMEMMKQKWKGYNEDMHDSDISNFSTADRIMIYSVLTEHDPLRFDIYSKERGAVKIEMNKVSRMHDEMGAKKFEDSFPETYQAVKDRVEKFKIGNDVVYSSPASAPEKSEEQINQEKLNRRIIRRALKINDDSTLLKFTKKFKETDLALLFDQTKILLLAILPEENEFRNLLTPTCSAELQQQAKSLRDKHASISDVNERNQLIADDLGIKPRSRPKVSTAEQVVTPSLTNDLKI